MIDLSKFPPETRAMLEAEEQRAKREQFKWRNPVYRRAFWGYVIGASLMVIIGVQQRSWPHAAIAAAFVAFAHSMRLQQSSEYHAKRALGHAFEIIEIAHEQMEVSTKLRAEADAMLDEVKRRQA